MYIQKCKIRKCISLQNVLEDILQHEVCFPLNKTARTKFTTLHKTAQRSVQRVAQQNLLKN